MSGGEELGYPGEVCTAGGLNSGNLAECWFGHNRFLFTLYSELGS